jgi:hypothetical protein
LRPRIRGFTREWHSRPRRWTTQAANMMELRSQFGWESGRLVGKFTGIFLRGLEGCSPPLFDHGVPEPLGTVFGRRVAGGDPFSARRASASSSAIAAGRCRGAGIGSRDAGRPGRVGRRVGSA